MAVAALLAALVACTAQNPDADQAEPTTPAVATPASPEVSGAPSPTPTPTPWPKPTPAPPEPISVSVEQLDTELLDNAALRGGTARPFESQAVLEAAEGVRAAVERYLNAQFVNPSTRFGPAPAEALVAGGPAAALSAEERAALGVLDLEVDNVRAQPVAARVLVLVDGADVLTAAATYTARIAVDTPDGRDLLTQTATLVFSHTEDGWRADAVDAELRGRW